MNQKEKEKESNKCTCETETEEHTCPYATEICDNYELCTCCDFCMEKCSDEI